MPPSYEADPEVQELQRETEAIVARAAEFAVATAEQYSAAGVDLTRIKAAQKKLDLIRTKITRPMDAAKKAVLELFRAPAEKLANAEAMIKRALVKYQAEQDRLRQEEQRRADEAARKERERLQERATRAVASGKVEKAEVLQQQAASVVAPVIQREAPRVSGLSSTVVWKFEVVNASEVPREYCSVDETKIRKIVSALKGDTKIPGVRIYPDTQIRAGSAATV